MNTVFNIQKHDDENIISLSLMVCKQRTILGQKLTSTCIFKNLDGKMHVSRNRKCTGENSKTLTRERNIASWKLLKIIESK